MSVSVYEPEIGGERDPVASDIEIVSATVPRGYGTVMIVGDVLFYTANWPVGLRGNSYETEIAVTYITADGAVVDTTIPVQVIKEPGPQGLEIVTPGGRSDYRDAILSPVPLPDQLTSPEVYEYSYSQLATAYVGEAISTGDWTTVEGNLRALQTAKDEALEALAEIDDLPETFVFNDVVETTEVQAGVEVNYTYNPLLDSAPIIMITGTYDVLVETTVVGTVIGADGSLEPYEVVVESTSEWGYYDLSDLRYHAAPAPLPVDSFDLL